MEKSFLIHDYGNLCERFDQYQDQGNGALQKSPKSLINEQISLRVEWTLEFKTIFMFFLFCF